MKIENFDYFKNVTDTSSVQNQNIVDAKDFDIDFKQVADPQIPMTGYSGNTCTLLCKITEFACQSLIFGC